jgi:hypothetical protein
MERMNTDNNRQKYQDTPEMNALREKVIGIAYQVANKLGPGFLEKVYENAFLHELTKQGISA